MPDIIGKIIIRQLHKMRCHYSRSFFIFLTVFACYDAFVNVKCFRPTVKCDFPRNRFKILDISSFMKFDEIIVTPLAPIIHAHVAHVLNHVEG